MTRAIVVCPDIKAEKRQHNRHVKARLEEAINLTQAIHLDIVDGLIFPVQEIKPATIIGSGQIQLIATLAEAEKVEVVVFDCSLSPMQQRNLERAIQAKVIDRSALILEIFGERARTSEGKLQVELAALEYQKGRLVRSWTHLERQRGGFGFLGGPGESQIETDRRLIRERIASIKKELEKVVRTRGLHRKLREHVPYPTVALVGYTNAGKSTLFNRLTSSEVLAKDALFATLDPTTRKLKLSSGLEVLLSDTVGFISNLPTQLIAAFRATLEEVRQADILLHVRDITHEDTRAQRDDVLNVIEELFDKPDDIPPIIEVWNKCDAADEELAKNLVMYRQNPVAVSAVTGYGLEHLLNSIQIMLTEQLYQDVCYVIGHDNGKATAWLYRNGIVRSAFEEEMTTRLEVRLAPQHIQRFGREFGLYPQRAQEDMGF